MSIHRALAVTLLLTGCSSPSGDASSTPDGACSDWAAAYCARMNACSPNTLEDRYGTIDECVTRNKPGCLGSLKAAGTGATPATVESCSKLYPDADCNELLYFGGRVPEGCDVAGSLGAGAPCGDDSQCSGAGGYCKITQIGQSCGTCATRVGIDAGCSDSRDCDYGLICGGLLTCVKTVGVGGACDESKLVCDDVLACLYNVCVTELALGAPCDPQADICGTGGGKCDPKTLVCTAPVAPTPLGAPCSSNTTCATFGACGPQGTCVAGPADGTPCDESKGVYCTEPAHCVNSVCVLPDPSQCH